MMKPVLAIYFSVLVLFLILPLIFLVPISLTESQFLEFPPKTLSLRWYAAFFEDQTWVNAAVLSFRVGIGATIISLVVGTLASIALVRGQFLGKTVLTAIFIAPLILPTVILALALYIVFLRYKLVDNIWALTVAHSVVALPYVILLVSASLRRFDITLERAARVLGAKPAKAFLLVTLPYLVPSMFAAGILSFFASFDELIITLFISGGHQTLPVRIWNDLGLKLDPTVPAVAVMLTILSILGMGAGELIRRRNERRYHTTTSPEA